MHRLLFFMGLLASGSLFAAAQSTTNQWIWPPPPAAPRIAFRQSITSPRDFGIRPAWWTRLVDVVTGESHREDLVKPFGIGVAETGELLVTDTGVNAVTALDRVNRRRHRWDKVGRFRFRSPVAVVQFRALIYVADSDLRAVLGFDAAGQIRLAITNGLERPAGLAIADEKLFVADAGQHRVLVFNLQGQRITQFGQRGAAPSEFNYPTHLASDTNGHLFVTDSMNARVQILDRQTGQSRGVIGRLGDGSGQFSKPKGVAVDRAGHVYVVDAAFDNIQIFDQQGRFLLAFGSMGAQPGEFWLPAGIAIDREDRIYIADSYNRRVQIFQYVGER